MQSVNLMPLSIVLHFEGQESDLYTDMICYEYIVVAMFLLFSVRCGVPFRPMMSMPGTVGE